MSKMQPTYQFKVRLGVLQQLCSSEPIVDTLGSLFLLCGLVQAALQLLHVSGVVLLERNFRKLACLRQGLPSER